MHAEDIAKAIHLAKKKELRISFFDGNAITEEQFDVIKASRK